MFSFQFFLMSVSEYAKILVYTTWVSTMRGVWEEVDRTIVIMEVV